MPVQPDHVFKLALRGEALLHNPRWSKGTAFTIDERKAFGLTGRMPSQVNTLDEQCARAYAQLQSRTTPLGKNTFMQSMKEQNWVLYFELLRRNLRELMPIIYTPTEADAIADYSHLYRKAEGLYLSFPHQDSMEENYLEQAQGRAIDLVVCSDGEAILGIGDQGVGAIGISTAKAAVYTLIGGIDPSRALPVVLDVGTDNQELLNDPLYVGWKHERVRGKEYDDFMDKFVQIVRKHHPHSLLHFEDFGVTNAQRLLERYHEQHAVFNDDIQGTGAVTLAALMSAIGVTKTKLSDQRIIIFGAGSAGLGIAKQLRDAMKELDDTSKEEANKRFYLIDKFGLLTESLSKAGKVRPGLEEWLRPDSEWVDATKSSEGQLFLLDVVKHIKPTVLIGTSTRGGAFTEQVIKEMAKGCDRPIIFPLSNPSKLVEVDPKDANDWTAGKALLATGSPFPPAKMPNGKDYVIAECNNALIYPGLGFGAIISKSRIVSDTMIIAGARRLASLSPALKDPDDALLPDFGDSPQVNYEVACAVAHRALIEGNAEVEWRTGADSKDMVDVVRQKVKEAIWEPIYGKYEYDPQGQL
ncbi:hypothetical protein PUNSTDRAFT_117823 [Punctularia strigosozonata HHB-11173 SS5]|uniref:uncharacterized protein n=1 Tax=Punctularia strigosozonata (strain HHB-11173) TaxID=741275 RepID=UPI000441703B|nr:uncharacterized protein PUNSTDRAFT_117823 [Punctularia strigosozonata HHB-11173 SS5]EIN14284.1 hypothetical protein PUNSTDRAFT_117823 [Punctularia strigosozonata HHB-11173 SS5]